MKFTNYFMSKFGCDKVAHFFGGGWITSMFSPLGWLGILFGAAIVLVASFVKEKWLDDKFDAKDIFAAELGSVAAILVYVLVGLL